MGNEPLPKENPQNRVNYMEFFFSYIKQIYIYVAHNTTSEERERIIKRTVQKKNESDSLEID